MFYRNKYAQQPNVKGKEIGCENSPSKNKASPAAELLLAVADDNNCER
jgi:hypothetical protein